ncbi:MAG: hypothetical protein KKA42_12135 [candidate division Zixibacteria bacterium]|nr:hypothetical protein [candidate division Zixibacteria bacterium]
MKLTDEQVEALRLRLQEKYGVAVRSKRIRAIRLNSACRWQPPLYIEVGTYCGPLEQDGPNELILAIFEATTFIVCTPDHGVDSGMPHFFAKEDVHQVVAAE